MAYWFEGNLYFGFHKSLVNTFLYAFNNVSLDVNVLAVAESSQDQRRVALYPRPCI